MFNVALVFYENRKNSFLVRRIYLAKHFDIPYCAMYKSLKNSNFEIKYFQNGVDEKFHFAPVDAESLK